MRSYSRFLRQASRGLLSVLSVLFLAAAMAGIASAQAVTGTIAGQITDATGAAVPDATVEAANTGTGVSVTKTSNSDGAYSFVNLPIGIYDVTASKTGFQTFKIVGIKLDAGAVYTSNVKLQVSTVSQTVTVEANALQVQTANTQLGAVISGNDISNMPLINRNPLALMQTEPGVMASNDRFGTNSVNGSQTQQNSYLINGTDFNDIALNTPLSGPLAPNPDAIGEMSIVTNTLNPEYGRNSGAIVNQVVRSGSNAFHGNAGEFYRDTFLNTRDAFNTAAGAGPQIFHRNIFDGTIGGPIIKNHLFFFGSYEGLRQRSAAAPTQINIYSNAQLAGTFGAGTFDVVMPTTDANGNPVPQPGQPGFVDPRTVSPIPEFGDQCPTSGPACAAGTPYGNLVNKSGTVFPGFGNGLFASGNIPTQDFNTTAFGYISKFNPIPNVGTNAFVAQFPAPSTVNQELFRIDYNATSKDSFWGYGYVEKQKSNSVLPFTGANVPGFPSQQSEGIYNYTVSWNHVFNAETLNDLRVGYTRFNFQAVEPLTPVLPSSIGFAISPQTGLTGAGLPFIGINGGPSFGFSTNGPQPRIDQNYQANDDFAHTMGNHQFKVGMDVRKFSEDNPFFARENGSYAFNGNGIYSTTDPFADALLGFADSYNQTSGGLNDFSAMMFYTYAQDSWKARSNLVVNYGLGWEINTPFTDHFNGGVGINCFRPGEQSSVFPTAPVGLVFPGDAGCSSAGYSTKYRNFGPRLGIAWSPDLGWLSGGPGKMSVRAGVGIYYDQIEEEGFLQNLTAPPFQLSSAGFNDVGGTAAFQNPFAAVECLNQQNQPIAGCKPINASTGAPLAVTSISNKFPFTSPAKGTTNIDFASFGPLSLNLVDPNYGVPYAENYNLTVQRQVGSAIVTVGYVGAVGRHTERAQELNPLLNAFQCAQTADSCGSPNQFASPEAVYKYPAQTSVVLTPTLPQPESIFFASLAQQGSDGNSHYNALQASVQKSLSHGLDFLVAYTWSHSIDDSSSLEDAAFNGPGTNTFLPALNYGDSAFDARQRLVVSFDYQLPMPSAWTGSGFGRRALKGWRISGITTAQTGFPFNVLNFNFTSLTCNQFEFFSCPDNLQTNAPLVITNPRSPTSRYFNKNAFAFPALGTFGNVARNSIHGPGLWDTDMAVYKDTQITERMSLQLRMDAQNAFNHVSFNNPSGNIDSSRFGRVSSDGVEGPRIVQLGARFIF